MNGTWRAEFITQHGAYLCTHEGDESGPYQASVLLDPVSGELSHELPLIAWPKWVVVERKLTPEESSDVIINLSEEGTADSGHRGHRGIPGYRGGSLPAASNGLGWALPSDEALNEHPEWLDGIKLAILEDAPEHTDLTGIDRAKTVDEFKPEFDKLLTAIASLTKPAATKVPVFDSEAEAQLYVRKAGLVEGTCSFRGMDTGMVRDAVQSLADTKAEFPDLRIRHFGNHLDIRQAIKTDLHKFYADQAALIGRGNDKALIDRWTNEGYAKGNYNSVMGRNDWASARSWSSKGRITTDINLSSEWWSKPAELRTEMRNMVKVGYHPPGTGTAKAVIDHELMHVIGAQKNINTDPRMTQLFNASTSTVRQNLSQYAAGNVKEFMAEAWSEVKNNPSPRPMAQEVVALARTIIGEQP